MEVLTHTLLIIFSGSVTGFALALTGSGGSVLGVPLLLYLVGINNPHIVIGTSAFAVSTNAFINLAPYAKSGHVRWRIAFIFTICGVLGAFMGSLLGKNLDGEKLMIMFAILMLVMAVLMKRTKPTSVPTNKGQKLRKVRLSTTGFGAGTLAGFFGVGGGFLIVPGLVLSARLPMIDAIGTSLFGVGSFGLTTALSYAYSGFVDWSIAITFILGGAIGGWIGAKTAIKFSQRQGLLTTIFAATIFITGIYMLLKHTLLN